MAYLNFENCCPSAIRKTFNDLCCRPTNAFIEQWLQNEKLGFHSAENKFVNCPVSLSPWTISETSFSKATQTSRAIARLLVAVSQNAQFLNDALSDYFETDSLLTEFKHYLAANPHVNATPLTISRQDFLKDNSGEWKLVEANAIAAGMGPFSEALQNLQRIYNPLTKFAPNSATRLQAQALYQATQKLSNPKQPTILFLVDENEDNIFDQARLIKQLEQLGASVIKLDLLTAKARITSYQSKLIIDKKDVIDGIYFRTGYNLDDYKKRQQNLISLRYWFEQHQVVVAPSISMQVASSKWLQMKLSQLSVEQIVKFFNLTMQEATLAFNALNTEYRLVNDISELNKLLKSKQWILKTQNEGGGNISDQIKTSKFSVNQAPFFLMQKIPSKIRNQKQAYYAEQQLQTQMATISELGIFNLGEELNYGGYLLRTKPTHQLEAGVHQGGGLLDCLALEQKSNAE